MTPDLCDDEKPQIVVLAGPTGSGKSSLACRLAGSSGLPPLEIISADSRQVYRGLDIGTDKVSDETRRLIPHHLLDIIDPDTRYSAAQFARDAHQCIESITCRGGLPLIVGGTGLYIRILTGGLASVGAPVQALRDRYQSRLMDEGPEALYEQLQMRDPRRAASISPSDTFRVIRALEILDSGTSQISNTYDGHGFRHRPYDSLKIVLNVDRKKLYKRIDMRVDAMIENGLIEEVDGLRRRFDQAAPAMNGIGYAQIGMYLDGIIPLDQAVSLIRRDTRRYAKRQLTWFKKEPDTEWLDYDPDEPDETLEIVKKMIRRFYDNRTERR